MSTKKRIEESLQKKYGAVGAVGGSVLTPTYDVHYTIDGGDATSGTISNIYFSNTATPSQTYSASALAGLR